MNWYLTTIIRKGVVIERGWMLAATDVELIDYARVMGYGIDITFLGAADMTSVTPELLPEERA